MKAQEDKARTSGPGKGVCRLCGHPDYELVETLTAKPDCEHDIGIAPEDYYREVRRCDACDVYYNAHDYIDKDFYEGFYNAQNTRGTIKRRFAKVMSLDPKESDNAQRCARIDTFLQGEGRVPSSTRALDVGFGIGVFLVEMRRLGYDCVGVDPDSTAVAHAASVTGSSSLVTGTMYDIAADQLYTLISFNKVLEHVADPIENLVRAGAHLEPGGTVYVELPDGEAAIAHGGVTRPEFILDHLTIFTQKSFEYLAKVAGYEPAGVSTVTDPSGKYTLYGFLKLTA